MDETHSTGVVKNIAKSHHHFIHIYALNGLLFLSLIFTLSSLHDTAPSWHPFFIVFFHSEPSQDVSRTPKYSAMDTAEIVSAFQSPALLIHRRNNQPSHHASVTVKKTEKLILLWFDGVDSYHSPGPHIFSRCPESRCSLTTNLADFKQSAAVLFVAHYMFCSEGAEAEPIRVDPKQIFAMTMGESPAHAFICGFMRKPDFFNWTMTYRLDSDIRAHATYSVPLQKKKRNFAKGKTKLVAWLVSHCDTQGLREKYVLELSKFVPVDIYGKCSNVSCGDNCDERLRDYKFYLAFENSMCKDYITEKAIRALEHETVPIVYGDGDYRIFPPNSYIHVYNFSTPKHLAAYLLKLDQNDTAYNELMKWRYKPRLTQSHGLFSAKTNGFCAFCQKLHNPTFGLLAPKSYSSIVQWWTRGPDIVKAQTDQTMCRRPDWLFTRINMSRYNDGLTPPKRVAISEEPDTADLPDRLARSDKLLASQR